MSDTSVTVNAHSSADLSPNGLKRILQKMDSCDFENLIADIWEVDGYQTEVLQQSRDGGVDVIAESHGLTTTRTLIQAKRYKEINSVGVDDLRRYETLSDRKNADEAIIVTTGRFSRPARKERDNQNYQIKLIDGSRLVEIINNLEAYGVVDQYFDFESSSSPTEPVRSETEQSKAKEQTKPSDDVPSKQSLLDYVTHLSSDDEDITHGTEIVTRFFDRPPRTWWQAIIAIGPITWGVALAGGTMDSSLILSIMLISWIALPLSIYKDYQIAREYIPSWQNGRDGWAVKYIIIPASFLLFTAGSLFIAPGYLFARWIQGRTKINKSKEETKIRETLEKEIGPPPKNRKW